MTDHDHILSHLYQISEDLNFCGCGSPQAAWEVVHSILCDLRDNGVTFDGDGTTTSDGMYHIVLSTIDAAELIDHGTVVRRSWLTQKGKWMLWAVEQVGGIEGMDDKLEMTGFPHDGTGCSDESCWLFEATIEA